MRLTRRRPHQPLKQQARPRSRRPPGDPAALEVGHLADRVRVPARDDKPLLAPPQMHQVHRLPAEHATRERIVPAPARRVPQVDRARIRRAARKLNQPIDAAARPRHHLNGATGRSHE
jgi:hypothetical protein